MLAPHQTFTSIADARTRQVSQVADNSVQDQTYVGRQLVTGVGKSFFHIDFPMSFSGMPLPTLTAVLDPRNPFGTLGADLWASAMVVGWDVNGAIPGAFEGYFVGAEVCVWVSGYDSQLTWIAYSFHGPALRNPIDVIDPEIL